MRWMPLVPLVLAACVAGGPTIPGAPCTVAAVARCDEEAPRLVHCLDGTWTVLADCLGPQGCSSSEDTVSCDASGNGAGARCLPSSEGLVRCEPDGGTAILQCLDGGLEVVRTCEPPTTCVASPSGGLTCGL